MFIGDILEIIYRFQRYYENNNFPNINKINNNDVNNKNNNNNNNTNNNIVFRVRQGQCIARFL